MNDALEQPVRINIDLHFGRRQPITIDQKNRTNLIQSAKILIQNISDNILHQTNGRWESSDVLCHIFDKKNALPQWLLNKALVQCENTRSKIEPSIIKLIQNPLNKRRFLDYICGELLYHCWLWSDSECKRHWIVQHTANLCDNIFCKNLNNSDYVLKLNNSILGESIKKDAELYHWYIASLGTINLIDCTTKPIFEYTAQLLATKYKTSFILDVFKKLFADTYRAQDLGHWAVLVLGDIPKVFSLSDFLDQHPGCHCLVDQKPTVTRLLCQTLESFDAPEACPGPDARFRLGGDRPPQNVLERVGSMFWLRRTLDVVKDLQQKHSASSRGMHVSERSFLSLAMKQKCILYCNLFDEQLDPELNPCSIQSIHDTGMILVSPQGNKLNSCRGGQEIHGYFSIIDGKRKSTYCDFRTTVRSLRSGPDGTSLVDIAFPAAFELTRRSHKRLRLNGSQLKEFSLIVPPDGGNGNVFDNLDNWPAPLCRLPTTPGLCEIKDLSAGGLMLEIHENDPAFNIFGEEARETGLLALLHLSGQQNLPDLRLPLRLQLKRIRHFAPLHTKYLGMQFTEAGEIRNQKYIRWKPVGKEGVFLIADWIFRDTISH